MAKSIDITVLGYGGTRSTYMEIVDDMAGAVRLGELDVRDTSDMADQVTAKVGSDKISGLFILDHGNVGVIRIGADRITSANVALFLAHFMRLRGLFDPNGFIWLMHCKAGTSDMSMLAIAKAANVTVFGGTGYFNPIYGFNTGQYVEARPDGTFTKGVPRPRPWGSGG